jgi:hypothetical protein
MTAVVQVALGSGAVLAMWGLTRWANSDAKKRLRGYTGSRASRTRVLDGVVNAEAYNKKTYNTTGDGAVSFLPMFRSVNRQGGAQFSYSTWVYVDRPLTNACVLFLRGDNRPYPFQRVVVDEPGAAADFQGAASLSDRTVVCPLVELRTDGGLNIAFNSTTDMLHRVELSASPSKDSAVRANLPSITPQRWVLVTVVFQDNMPLADFENGLNVRVYINDFMYKESRFPRTALVQNSGSFHLLPDGPPSGTGLRLSDLSYHNYALTDAQIGKLYKKGPSLHEHRVQGKKPEDVLLSSAFNATDLYNF